MTDKTYNVLFLCTGNSARSVMAESLLNRFGKGRFRAYSAGSHPTGQVHPLTLETLASAGLPTDGLRSKGWDEFALPGAPAMDLIFTVCDRAAGEICPVWPGQPVTAHWGFDDPAACAGPPDRCRAGFKRAFAEIQSRIQLLVNLPMEALDRLALKRELERIAQITMPPP